MDSENATKLDALVIISLVLIVLTLLTLGTYIFFVVVNHFPARGLDWDLVWNGIQICAIFSVLLSILSIIVGIFTRRRGSEKQIKVANICLSVGLLGIITSAGLFMYFINWMLSII